MSQTSTDRPRQQIPLVARAVIALLLFGIGLEMAARWCASEASPLAHLCRQVLTPVLSPYLAFRASVVAHPLAAGAACILGVGLLLVLYRALLLFWHNQVAARLAGTKFATEVVGFPMHAFDLLAELGRRPKRHSPILATSSASAASSISLRG